MIYQRIMVAVDGSEISYLALQEAIRLAKDQHAELRIVHVIDESIVYTTESHVDYASLWQVYREEGLKFLDKLSEEIRKAQIAFDCKLVELKPFSGKLAEKIVEEVKVWLADLLVLGTHGRRGLNHFILGSVAESVIRIAPTPVLLIRGR
ncbi:universal stress protein [Legionella maceachernii]|uniref:Universal stress protein n=1 Tax=Legionella maceachernii TaxID=466 RepID=A0A0W0W0U2_9GAMM|nr:universal stress protein [Legionella maceachernii]KTD26011.1 universal stress protein [Legionella maceachernii]SJZ50598.1 Nucleotide-binding universal stress protein, UspA family [Legionella maceachernii]SUP03743.1 Putative universal stress protein SAV1710 [Legionella maceachernii]